MQSILLVDIPTVLMTEHVRIYPPHWAAYLSSYLKIEVDYLDARVEDGVVLEKQCENDISWFTYGLPISDLSDRILKKAPDILGIHIGVSTELRVAQHLLQELRVRNNKIKIILGGPGITMVPKGFLDSVFWECEICTTTSIGKTVDVNLLINSCDINILPDRKVFEKYEQAYQKINRFHSGPPLVSPTGQMMASTGCGGKCSFCTTRGKKRFERSLLSIKSELTMLREEGVLGIQFEDDNFLGWTNKNIQHGISILRLIAEMGFLGIEFPNGLTIHSMNNVHFLNWLREALKQGIKIKLSLPFESASDKFLQIVQKPHRHKQCKLLMEKLLPLVEKGLQLEVFLQVGLATVDHFGNLILESDNSIKKTMVFAKELKVMGVIADIFFNSPIPGTDIFPIWKERFPDSIWEQLLLTEPSLFFEKSRREELKAEIMAVNNSPRV